MTGHGHHAAPLSYDVFLSCSAEDRTVAERLANHLSAEGLRVWISAAHTAKATRGVLDISRVLVFCMSRHSFGRDWPTLERQVLRFMDPKDPDRRFVPLRLDDVEAPGSLSRALALDFRAPTQGDVDQLVQACQRRTVVEEVREVHAEPPFVLMPGHIDEVRAVVFHPDSRRAVTGSGDGTVRVWDLDLLCTERVLYGHRGPVTSVVLSSDGRFVFSGSLDETVIRWDLSSGDSMVIDDLEHQVTVIALSPDGARLATGLGNRVVGLWDSETGDEIRAFSTNVDNATALSFSPDGSHLLVGESNGTVGVHHLESDDSLEINAHDSEITALGWSGNGERIVSGAANGRAAIWNARSGQRIAHLPPHGGAVLAARFDGDAGVVSGDESARLSHWQPSRHARDVRHYAKASVTAMDVDQERRRILAVADDGTLLLHELDTGGLIATIGVGRSSVQAVACHPSTDRALTTRADGQIFVWDLTSAGPPRTLDGHDGVVRTLAVSADGRRAFSGASDRTVRAWDVEAGTLERVLEGHAATITAVACTPDGTTVVSGDRTGKIHVWGPDGDLLVAVSHPAAIRSLAVRPDGGELLSGGADGVIGVWHLPSGRPVRSLSGHMGPIWSLDYSPDSHRAVSGSAI